MVLSCTSRLYGARLGLSGSCVHGSMCVRALLRLPVFLHSRYGLFSEALESGCVFLVVATTKGSWEQKVAQNRWMLERLALHECMID